MRISDWSSDVCSSDLILFEFPRKNCWSIGFITGPVEPSIQELTPDDTVNIFMPTTPNPTKGFLLFLPRRETQTLELTVEEGLKMVVYVGIVTQPDSGPPLLAESYEAPPMARSNWQAAGHAETGRELCRESGGR